MHLCKNYQHSVNQVFQNDPLETFRLQTKANPYASEMNNLQSTRQIFLGQGFLTLIFASNFYKKFHFIKRVSIFQSALFIPKIWDFTVSTSVFKFQLYYLPTTG